MSSGQTLFIIIACSFFVFNLAFSVIFNLAILLVQVLNLSITRRLFFLVSCKRDSISSLTYSLYSFPVSSGFTSQHLYTTFLFLLRFFPLRFLFLLIFCFDLLFVSDFLLFE